MVVNLFSKRQKKLRGEVPDIYSYNEIPNSLRVQIVHIWDDVLGNDVDYAQRSTVREGYKVICDILCREYGLFELPKTNKFRVDYNIDLSNYFIGLADIEKVIDIIELSFKVIENITNNRDYLSRYDSSKYIVNAIEELNARFKEHGIGYQYISGEIIRVDSEIVHSETVKPVLKLLHDKRYKGAEEEFLKAYTHYRKGNYKEAINESLKSFESTMKSICDKRKWDYSNNATSKQLVDICFNNNLIPSFWEQQFNSLRGLFKSSIPTGRNKLSGHGQGSDQIELPEDIVRYILHMTASTLLFLIEAERKL